LDKLAGQ